MSSLLSRISVVSLSVLTLASCAKPKPPAWTQPQPIDPHALPPPEPDVSTRGPSRLASLGGVGCQVDTHGAPAGATLKLSVTPEAKKGSSDAASLEVTYDAASFGLATGDASVASVSLEVHGVKLGGFVDRARVPLHVRPSHKLASGMVTPLPSLALEIAGVDAGTVRARLPKLELLEVPESARVAAIGCDDLGATPFEPIPPTAGKEVWLDVKGGLGLSPAPGEPPLVTLHASAPDAATQLETKGKEVLVELASPEMRLTGWVPKDAVKPRKKERDREAAHAKTKAQKGAETSSDATKGTAKEPPPEIEKSKPAGLECKIPLDVVVPERIGEKNALVWIGEVHPGTLVVLDDDPKHPPPPTPMWRSVVLRGVSANVPIVVRAESLETCAKRL